MRDTEATLAAFSDHCNRAGLFRRPTMFVRFIDIWNEPKGEIGVPDPEDLHHTAFALLSPWIMVPTIGEAHLVVDRVECIEVTKVRATFRGYFEPSYQVDYRMADGGSLEFGEITDAPCLPEIGTAITAAKKARMEQRFWQREYQFEDTIGVVEGMLNR